MNILNQSTLWLSMLAERINILWSTPLQAIICLILLWQYLGVASLTGIVIMILTVPLNAYLSNKSKNLFIAKWKFQDERIKTINEILSGIKVIKLYGWEISFQKLVDKIRASELSVFLKSIVYNMLTFFTAGASFFIVTN